MTSIDGGTVTYAYDGDGRRVKKTVSGVSTFYFYAEGMGIISEFTTTAGATGASSTDRTSYRTSDKLGTAVLLINSSGVVVENNRTLPYGEAWLSDTGSMNEQKFTSYLRDPESGLDYAMARYYASSNGRFLSVDPDQRNAKLEFPQTWNAYIYLENDPINGTDPTGEFSLKKLFKVVKIVAAIVAAIVAPPIAPFIATTGIASTTGAIVAGLIAAGAAAAEEALKEDCFADLKSRDVEDLDIPAEHAFWWVKDRNGSTHIISGGPSAEKNADGTPYLRVWVVDGNRNGKDHSGVVTAWSSGTSPDNCDAVDRMLAAGRSFPTRRVEYHPIVGPNSNSAARYIGNQGGFHPSAPAGVLSWGWNVPIHF